MKKGLPAWAKLALIALVAGLLLGFTNELTAPAIAAQNEMQAEAARRAVLPQAEDFEPLQAQAGAGVDACFAGKSGGALAGYVATVTTKGYGGEIEVTVGMGVDGAITGISVGGANFSETMGLGARTRDPEFTGQFQGLKAPLTLNQDVDAITSATISSNAVVGAVNAACAYMEGLLG